jgi:hypothetical protein
MPDIAETTQAFPRDAFVKRSKGRDESIADRGR